MKKILINSTAWETRIAITRENLLQNIYFTSPSTKSLERCYFKGVVTKILPGIQTAFVDIGQERSGFLHISEIDRELAVKRMTCCGDDDSDEGEIEEDERTKVPLKREFDMTKIFHEGEQILVQVSKEPIYEKGAKLTTCFTLPGRFIVFMPNIPRIGISKKIENPEERNRLRDLLRQHLPADTGAIIRTTSENHKDSEILADLRYLVHVWEEIQDKFKKAEKQEKLHEDIELALQVIRDNLDEDVDQIICDSKDMEARVYHFMKKSAPEHTHKIKFYEDTVTLFERFNIDAQIEQALQSKVSLKSGGTLIIEATEAMTVIDVNTGKFTGTGSSLEDTIFKTNLEAADEVVRQLRLRNFGGLIVIDFIDMTNHSNKQKLFKHFEKALRERDKFQSVVLRVSEFGLVQMTRKRSGKTLIQQLTTQCSCCGGNGFIKSAQHESYAILRKLREALVRKLYSKKVIIAVHHDVFEYLINKEYNAILSIEKTFNCKITVAIDEHTQRLNVYSISEGA